MAKDPETPTAPPEFPSATPPVATAPAPVPESARRVRYRAKVRGFWQGHLVEAGQEFMGPPNAKASWFEPAATAKRSPPAQSPKPITSEGLTGQLQPGPQPPDRGGQGQTGQ
jgi:hypothetical protein